MKSKSQKNQDQKGLQSRPEQQQSTATAAQPPAALIPETPEQSSARSEALRVGFAKRAENRQLPTDQVLALLKRWLPVAFERAEVVGQWVWVAFDGKQPQSITAELSQLGFHWNNRRQVWQHPCGVFRGEPVDPRAKYSTASAQEVVA